MSTARDEILANVRTALGNGGPRPDVTVPRDYRRRGTLDPAALADLLAERIAEYRATVHRVGPGEVQATIDGICGARAIERLGVPVGLPQEWRPASVPSIEDRALSTAELDALDAVVTGCTLAIAGTGTIVLTAAPADGRRALTLVPDVHVCVVGEEQIVELVPEAMERLEPVAREGRPITFVSGPSATSDIELSRVEGVHGPRTLEVVVVTC